MGRILSELYFVTTTVVDWVDIFTRPKYKHIVIDSDNCGQMNSTISQICLSHPVTADMLPVTADL